jgi:hypothetical protein
MTSTSASRMGRKASVIQRPLYNTCERDYRVPARRESVKTKTFRFGMSSIAARLSLSDGAEAWTLRFACAPEARAPRRTVMSRGKKRKRNAIHPDAAWYLSQWDVHSNPLVFPFPFANVQRRDY